MLFCGCSNSKTRNGNNTNFDDNFYKIENSELTNAVFNYDLQYQINVPGQQFSYNVLWTGYDPDYYGINLNKESRFFTYLTEYKESYDCFYALYLPETELNKPSAGAWVSDYLIGNTRAHFVEDDKVVDGKYLFYAQKNIIDNYLVCGAKELSDIPFSFSNYQIAICLQSKTMTILENISTGTQIHKKINLLRRYETILDSETNKLTNYVFEDAEERDSNKYIDSVFSYSGYRIEAYPSAFEEMSFCYCPKIGLKNTGFARTIKAELLDSNRIILPRFYYLNGEKIDLLDSNFDYSNHPLFEDVYRSFKPLFLEAYLMDSEYKQRTYQCGIFNFTIVKSIIREARGAFL